MRILPALIRYIQFPASSLETFSLSQFHCARRLWNKGSQTLLTSCPLLLCARLSLSRFFSFTLQHERASSPLPLSVCSPRACWYSAPVAFYSNRYRAGALIHSLIQSRRANAQSNKYLKAASRCGFLQQSSLLLIWCFPLRELHFHSPSASASSQSEEYRNKRRFNNVIYPSGS
jgi:hypothetical protein